MRLVRNILCRVLCRVKCEVLLGLVANISPVIRAGDRGISRGSLKSRSRTSEWPAAPCEPKTRRALVIRPRSLGVVPTAAIEQLLSSAAPFVGC